MCSGCVLDVLWMCSGLAYYFFSPLSLQLLTTICHTFLIIAKYVFSSFHERGTKKKESEFFSLSHAQDKTQKKYLFLFTDLKNYNNIFLIIIGSTNNHLIDIFLYSHYLFA